MPSSSRVAGAAVGVLMACTVAASARAQQQAQGFAVERLYPSAPGGGWFVMDALDMRGGFGGAMQLTTGYARKPLLVGEGAERLSVVSARAFTDFGFAATYDRWRLYLDMTAPILIDGHSGAVGGYSFTGPSVDLGSNPDTLADVRIGFDGRLLGSASGPFRLGAGAQLIVPNGNRSDYDTDGTLRAMVRALFAGDVGLFTYAGQLGVHVRPLDDSPVPGSPQGSELLFGVAGGVRLALTDRPAGPVVVVGPEVYGETAFKSFLGSTGTGVEGLLSGRLEGTADQGMQLRVKLGAGGGLDPSFGAPQWRLVLGLELFNHDAGR